MIDLLLPEIFPKSKIISGVTKVNYHLFPSSGLSISAGEILTQFEVLTHRQKFAELINIDFGKLKFQKQVHGDRIRIIDSNSIIEESDGMITSEKGLVICISIADCGAVLVYDSENEVIGAVHSGWRGTQQNIVSKLIIMMVENYSSKVENLLTYISPCAGGDLYEVNWDVAQYFPESIKQISDDKYLFENAKAIKLQLLSSGIKSVNIESANICTISDTNFHSFRRDKAKSGRMAAFIGMTA